MTKTFSNKFRNASEAFEYWYQCIEHYGTNFAGTKALFNIGFEMAKPYERNICLLYTSPSPRDRQKSRMPSSA